MTHARLAAVVPILAVALLAASSPPPLLAAEDCADFSRYARCPPPAATCLIGPAPDSCAQDCSTCTPDVDDDKDCVVDEELLDGADNDGDGLVDEDISCLDGCDPLSYECPSSRVDAAALGVPAPIEAPGLRLPARVDRFDCAGGDSLLAVDVELAPDPADPAPACGVWRLVLTVRERGGPAVYFEGPAIAVLTRRFESLDRTLIAGSSGNVQVYRYTLRADVARRAAYANLPAALKVPCNEDQAARPHLFLYGTLDVARDASRPDDRAHFRTAVVLGHTPGRFSHPPDLYDPAQDLCGFADVSTRGIAASDPASHPGEGWLLAAPGDSFTFSASAPVPAGDRPFGRIRQVPSGPGEPCAKETRICETQIEDPGPGGPCAARARYRRVRFCGQDDGASPCPSYNNASLAKCDILSDDLVALFPVGSFGESEFPGTMTVSLLEGSLACYQNFEPYWYGSYTTIPSASYWRGPDEAIDVVDNQVLRQTGVGQWLIGALNWVFEGQPNERFAPRQFRTMYFFSSSNPDIPTRAPCQATARVQPAAPALCGGGADLALSGAGSSLVHCCQCGGLEYRWSRDEGGSWVVVEDWSADPLYEQMPGPGASQDFRLEVHCSTSRRACVDEEVVTVRVDAPVTVDAGPDVRVCAGQGTTLTATIAGASRPPACAWTPATGLADPGSCTTAASPAATTTYTVTVTAGACSASDAVEVAVAPRPVADAGGPGPVVAPAPIGSGPCDPGLEYRWTPTRGLTPPDACDPLAEPLASTAYCLVVRDPVTGCESDPDCIDVLAEAPCTPAEIPPAVRLLKGIRAGRDVALSWEPEPLAAFGYRVYRVERKADIPFAPSAGARVITTAPDPADARGTDPDAVPPAAGENLFYQAVGVCADGVSEGPL